jgi:hypothetical protein
MPQKTKGGLQPTHQPNPTAKEATKLIEAGFQYVTTIEGIQLFRKRK